VASTFIVESSREPAGCPQVAVPPARLLPDAPNDRPRNPDAHDPQAALEAPESDAASESAPLSEKQKAAARKRAEEADRRYPNLVDNMWAARRPK
jgi:hypothetical protein